MATSTLAAHVVQHPLILDAHQQQLYHQAHAHATILAHATQHAINTHFTSKEHADVIHTQIQRHGDKHVFDLVIASVVVLIIMCSMLTLLIVVYFGCVSKSFKLIPLRYLCCPFLLLCRRQEDTGSSSTPPINSGGLNRCTGGGGSRGVGKLRV